MKTTWLTVAMLAGISAPAMAGVFVGVGIGSESKLQDQSGRFTPSGRSERLQGGYAIPLAVGRLSIEGAYTGYDLTRGGPAFSASELWLAGRYNFPIGNGFEVFGRLGVEHTALDTGDPTADASGNGMVGGAGFEFHPQFKLGVDLSAFVDFNYSKTHLDSQRLTGDTSDHLFTAGVSVGF